MTSLSHCLCWAALAPLAAGAARADLTYLEKEMPADAHYLHIGDPAPDFHLPGVDGRTYSLDSFKDAPVLMVAFMSNHCPCSHAAETRLLPLYAKYRGRGLAVIAINPNSPAGLDVSELGYSKYNDTFADMKVYARAQGFTFPYVYDGDTQRVAKAYGCQCTPDIFIFDRARRLRYEGRLDNSEYPEPETVTRHEAADAVAALLAGQPVPVPVTSPFGCATKWIEKQGAIAQINEKWESTPVTLAPIDGAGVAGLVRNPTANIRLINVWATWCVPCVEEFPNLVHLIRQFQTRRFELITVSLDAPDHRAQALRFLQKQHAALPDRLAKVLPAEGRQTDNYLFHGRAEDLQAALDPQWPGPVPYTLIVGPGGKVLYRHIGPIDLAEVRSLLVDRLGRYYNPVTKD